MVDRGWSVDPLDPRAPPREVWDRLSEQERARICAALPTELPRAVPPEGDRHRVPKTRALEALSEFFSRIGRRVYLSSELPVYYPGEPVFAPDLLAVLDVETHERDRWVVSEEGKGLDLVLEVTAGAAPKKDFEDNVERYARIGIPEYFVLDVRTERLLGYRLEPGGGYRPIVPQQGRWTSRVLGLELALEAGRIRFFHGSAPLLEAAELIARLEVMMDEVVARREAAEERARVAEERAGAAEERAGAAEERADRLARRLRELGVDPDDQ